MAVDNILARAPGTCTPASGRARASEGEGSFLPEPGPSGRSSATANPRSYLARSVAVVMGGLALNQAVTTLATALIAHILPTARLFGVLSLTQQALSMAGLFLTLGLNSSLVYDLATGHPDADRTFGLAWRGQLLWSVLLAAAVALAAPLVGTLYREPALASGLLMTSPSLVTGTLVTTVLAVLAGRRRFTAQSVVMLAATSATVLGQLVIAWTIPTGPHIAGLIVDGGAAGNLLAGVGAAWALRHEGSWDFNPVGTLRGLRRHLRYGIPLWLSNVAKSYQLGYLVMVVGTDRIAAAGFAQAAVNLVGYPQLVTWALRIVTIPFIAQVNGRAEREERAVLCFRYNNYLLYPVCLVLLVWGAPLSRALFGDRLAGAAQFLPGLTVGMFFSAVCRLAADVLAALDRSMGSLKVMLLPAVSLVTLAPLLVPRGVLLGPDLYAAGWVLSAVYAWLLLRRHGVTIHLGPGFGAPLLPSLPLLALAPLPPLPAAATGGLWAAALGLGVLVAWRLERDHAPALPVGS